MGYSLSELLDFERTGDFTVPEQMRGILELLERAGGWVSDWDEDLINGGFRNLPEFAVDKLNRGFPGGLAELSYVMSAGNGMLRLGEEYEGGMLFIGDNIGAIQELVREWKYRSDELHLWSARGIEKQQGLAPVLLNGTYEVAKRLGIRRMELFAVNTGSYIWAKAGFLPDMVEWNAWDSKGYKTFKRSAEKQANDQEVQDAFAKLSEDDPYSLWDAVDHVPGGRRLFNVEGENRTVFYNAEFDMANSRQIARLEAYIAGDQ